MSDEGLRKKSEISQTCSCLLETQTALTWTHLLSEESLIPPEIILIIFHTEEIPADSFPIPAHFKSCDIKKKVGKAQKLSSE